MFEPAASADVLRRQPGPTSSGVRTVRVLARDGCEISLPAGVVRVNAWWGAKPHALALSHLNARGRDTEDPQPEGRDRPVAGARLDAHARGNGRGLTRAILRQAGLH